MSEHEPSTGVSAWSHLNLPAVLLGAAGTALSRLIGKATDIPAAMLDAKVQGIKDETNARSRITAALAQAVAKQAVKDPALMERAFETFVAKEYRHQENKEAIANKTAQLLLDKPI